MDNSQSVSRRHLLALSMATLAATIPLSGHAYVPRCKRMTVLGVGGAGGNVVNCLHRQGVAQATLMHANAKDVIRSSAGILSIPLEIPEIQPRVSLGETIRQTTEELAWNAWVALPETDRLVLVAGLGGCIGSYVTPALARRAKQAGVQVLGLLFLPFAWEGDRRHRERARQGLGAMKSLADTLRVIDMGEESQKVPAETSMNQFFDLQDARGARMVNELLGMT